MSITFYMLAAVLAAGLICDFLLLIPGRSGFSARLAERWNTPQLFCPKVLAAFRSRLADVLLWVGVGLLFGEELVFLVLEQLLPAEPLQLLRTVWSGLLCLAVVIRAACMPFSFRQLAGLAPVFLVAALILSNQPGSAYLSMIAQPVCLLIFFMGAPLRRVMQTALGLALVRMVITFSLCFAGVIPDHWNWLYDTDRYALGYGHFNMLGVAVMEMALLYVCLRFVRWRWWDTLLLAVAGVFVWVVPNSRTSALAILAVLLLTLAGRWIPVLFRLRAIQGLMALSWSALAAFSLIGGAFLEKSALLQKINSLITGRLSLIHLQMQGPAWRWFGTLSNGTLNWGTAADPAAWALDREAGLFNYHLLDNGYAFCLYMAGPIWLAALCIGYGVLIWRFLRSGKEDWPLAFLLVVIALYTVTERQFANTWAVLLLGNLWAVRPLSLKSQTAHEIAK